MQLQTVFRTINQKLDMLDIITSFNRIFVIIFDGDVVVIKRQ